MGTGLGGAPGCWFWWFPGCWVWGCPWAWGLWVFIVTSPVDGPVGGRGCSGSTGIRWHGHGTGAAGCCLPAGWCWVGWGAVVVLAAAGMAMAQVQWDGASLQLGTAWVRVQWQCWHHLASSWHRYSGVLSAYGLALADVVHEAQTPCALRYEPAAFAQLDERIAVLERQCQEALQAQGFTG